MYESLQAGRRVTLERVGMFADGVAVQARGRGDLRAVPRRCVDEIVLLDTDEICAAIQDVFEDTRSIVEPAGALAVAGTEEVRARASGWRGKRLVAINSGANMNFDRLRHVAERADLGGEREALLAVEIPEQPGSFLRLLRGARAAQRHRVQLPLRRRRAARRSSSASRSRTAARRGTAVTARCARRATRSPT